MGSLNQRLTTHLPEYIARDITEGETTEPAARMVRGVLMATWPDEPPRYFYKGYEIEEDKSVPSGYFGRWELVRQRWHASSMSECVAEVERRLAARAS